MINEEQRFLLFAIILWLVTIFRLWAGLTLILGWIVARRKGIFVRTK